MQGPKDRKQDRIDDADLVASMAKRLSLLEKDLKAKARELERIQAENESLRSRVSPSKSRHNAASGCAYHDQSRRFSALTVSVSGPLISFV